jgi:hypothetical protein
VFAKQKGIVNAVGIREWLLLWDNQKIKSGMSFATRHIKQITPTNGDYTLKTVADPFAYLSGEVREYMAAYKTSKIADTFSLQLSNAAGQIDCLEFCTRGSILYSLKN